MSVLLTGATGFIGNALMNGLDVDVLSLCRSTPEQIKKKMVVYDLASNASLEDLYQQLKPNTITSIIHAASVTPWSGTVNYRDDIKMAKNIATICNKLNIPTLFFLSGWNVYSTEAKLPLYEGSPLAPTTDYGMSKMEVESYLRSNLEGTTLVTLRLATVYGPGQQSPGLITNVVKSAFLESEISITSSETKRDYIYIDDFVEIMKRLLPHKFKENTVLNIGGGASVSVGRVAAVIQGICERDYGKKIIIKKNNNGPPTIPNDNLLSIEKLRTYTDDHVYVDIEKGIRKYIEWAKRENIL